MSCAAFTLLSLYAFAAHRTEQWLFWANVALAIVMLLVAVHVAWKKEYLANIGGPDVLLKWQLPELTGRDQIEFFNVGTSHAIGVTLEEFSSPKLFWHLPVEIPSLGPDEKRTIGAEFGVWIRPDISSEVGYMKDVLRSLPSEEKLSFWIRFHNTRGTTFRREFVLRLVNVDRKAEIAAMPSALKVRR